MRALCLALCLAWPATAARAQRCDDRALSLAAADLLGGEAPGVVEAARARGSTLPSVRGLRVPEGDVGRVAAFLARVGAAGAPVACGEAHAEGVRLVLAGARAATLELDGRRVRVALAEGWRAPRLYARDARGEGWEREMEGGRAELPSDLLPPVDVQVVATGPDGPRPVADARVGRGPARTFAPSDEPLLTRIRRLRESAHVGPLRANRLLSRVAARHAAAICRSGRVAHVLGGVDPVERLAREGIVARHVGETAARSEDVGRAFVATLNSPSHRAALTDRRFTDVGVGAAAGRCLVILLAAWPRPVPYQGER